MIYRSLYEYILDGLLHQLGIQDAHLLCGFPLWVPLLQRIGDCEPGALDQPARVALAGLTAPASVGAYLEVREWMVACV